MIAFVWSVDWFVDFVQRTTVDEYLEQTPMRFLIPGLEEGNVPEGVGLREIRRPVPDMLALSPLRTHRIH